MNLVILEGSVLAVIREGRSKFEFFSENVHCANHYNFI